ncbi:hypothetical protein FOL47_004883 [Perkinsus chesapeaki]|uniref:Uncharacterized protein n=1 Tax=Perkinsus chesapeaki TaxID=330153 RepID=A0A7J6M136_PERCH|nr:hypothetical protein FOL47_004883 [Perkinsus chesapeaki]
MASFVNVSLVVDAYAETLQLDHRDLADPLTSARLIKSAAVKEDLEEPHAIVTSLRKMWYLFRLGPQSFSLRPKQVVGFLPNTLLGYWLYLLLSTKVLCLTGMRSVYHRVYVSQHSLPSIIAVLTNSSSFHLGH